MRPSPTALLLSIALAAPAPAADLAPLAPSSKWRMDYGRTECRLLRSFGAGRAQATLQLGQLLPGPFELTVAQRGVPATDRPEVVRVSAGASTVEARAQGLPARGDLPALLVIRPDDAVSKAIATSAAGDAPTRLRVDFVRGYRAALDAGKLKAPLAALDACVDKLLRDAGLDPAQQRSLRSGPQPVGPPAGWFNPGDFPRDLNARMSGAVVTVRLAVGADGAVTGCTVAQAGGEQAFEDLTCRLAAQRARFTPAMGADGKPVAALWAQRVVWQPGAPFVVRGS